MCQHASAYVSIRQHTSAYVSKGHVVARGYVVRRVLRIRQHTSAYVSIRQAYVSISGRVSLVTYVSIRQHTSAYVSIS
jgi:hypothetical protein